MAIPSWLNQPNYLQAMSSGANLGLNVRQQGFNERMSIEQLRQDQVRQALAVQQLRAAEARAQQADRLRSMQFQAEQQQAEQLGKRYQDDLALRIRGQDFREQQAMIPKQMSPYQQESLSLRRQEIKGKPERLTEQQKADKWIIESEINALERELAGNSLLAPDIVPRLDAAKRKYRELFMPPEQVQATRNQEKMAEIQDAYSRMNPTKQRTLLPLINQQLEQLGASPISQPAPSPLLQASPAGGTLPESIVSAPMTNELPRFDDPAEKKRFVFDVKTGKWLQ